MSAVATLARLTWMRLLRGKTIWVSGLLVLLPLLVAGLTLTQVEDADERWGIVCYITLRSLVLLAPVLHLAPAIGEENDGKTYTYLWSRPVPRQALVLGKLLAIVPFLVVVTTAALGLAWIIVSLGPGEMDPAWLGRALAAAAAGIVAAGCFAVGAGSLLPRHPLILSLGYIFVGEQILSAIPAVRNLSAFHHAMNIADLPRSPMPVVESAATALLALALLSAFWLGLAIWRVRRLEFGGPDG